MPRPVYQLTPDWYSPYHGKAGLYLRWQGSTQKARALLERAEASGVAEPLLLLDRALVDLFDRRYQDVVSHLSSGFPEVVTWQFQIIPRAQLYAQVYTLMQRHYLARAYYDSARIAVHNRLRDQPNEPRLHGALGIAYAGLGRKRGAIEEGRKAVGLLPVSKEAQRGYYREWDLAGIYMMIGEHEAALGAIGVSAFDPRARHSRLAAHRSNLGSAARSPAVPEARVSLTADG